MHGKFAEIKIQMTGELNAPRIPLIKADTRWLKSPKVGVVFERHNTRSRETHRASQREKSVEQSGTLNSLARVANPPTVCPQSHACDVCSEERPLHEFESTSGHSTTFWAEYPRPSQRAQHLSSLWTPGKISATPLGQTSRSSCYRASQFQHHLLAGFLKVLTAHMTPTAQAGRK